VIFHIVDHGAIHIKYCGFYMGEINLKFIHY
jgi:hypothetical protein